MKFLFVILILTGISVCSGFKFLVVFPVPSKSHAILGEGHVRHLLKAGHQVTFITPVLIKNASNNLRQIDVSSNFKFYDKIVEKTELKDLMEKKFEVKAMYNSTLAFYEVIENTLANPEVQKLIYDPNEKYDAVIAEWLFTELFAGFSAVFQCPLIWSSTMEPHWMVLSLIDEIPNPAFTPDFVAPLPPPFTFYQRVKQLATVTIIRALKWYFMSARDEEIYESNFGAAIRHRGCVAPSFEEVKYNGSLMLGNSHVSSGHAIRLPQNYKAVSGYHIKEDVTPLPETLQRIFDNAKHGVIYFSLGSVVPSRKLPEEMKKGLLQVFRGLKQTVIWKFEEDLPNLPENIHIVEWAPQPSILAHPNCVLFITHGGLLSTIETIHYGKPIIGIPVFSDQFANVKMAVNKGFGLEVALGEDTSEKLKEAIEEILSTPKYSDKAKELSFIYHHRVAKPGAELVHWVEHVVLTRGAPHLRSPALNVHWYQKWYLDLLGLILLIMYILVKVIKYLCCRRKNIDVKKKNA